MASLQIEVASTSSPFNHSLRDHNRSANIKGYIHSQCIRQNKAGDAHTNSSAWLPSQNSKTDDSWLPAESDTRHHRKGHNDVDHSWLPTKNDIKGKGGTKTSEAAKQIDYSWLPDNNQKKHKTQTQTQTTTKIKINTNTNDKKSKNNHWALAREVVFSCDNRIQNEDHQKKSSDSLRIQQQDSPSNSRYNVESPNSGGVSSLLRKWTDLAEVNKDGSPSPASNRSNLGKENSPSKDGLKVISNSASQSPASTDEAWESDNTSHLRRFSCPLPSDPNAEKEKPRVVDIIKKLSRDEEMANGNGNGNDQSLPRIRTSLHNKQIEEHKGYKGVKVSRHQVRGRQAFENFLILTEHHKHRELKWLLERKAVSKFSHRSRLKALLRFKFLRVESQPKPKLEARRHRRCVSKTLELNNRLDIMDLRERFDSGSEKGDVESGKHRRNMRNLKKNEESFATPTAGKEVDFKIKNTTIIKKQEPCSKPDPMTLNQQSTNSSKYVVQKAKDILDSSDSMIMPKARYKLDDEKFIEFQEDEGQFMSAKTSYGYVEDRGLISDTEEADYTGKKQVESFEDWMTNEDSQARSELDEEETYDMQILDTNYDWISDVSRPKSFWEDLRQARYQEMLDQCSGNVDIPRLLERKTVSRFLSSGLRELIDNLMMSRVQQSNVQVENQEVVVSEKGVSRKEEVEQAYGSMVDEGGVYRGRTGRQYIQYGEYVDQTPYSERSWRRNDGVYSPDTTTTTTTTATTSPSLDRSSHVNSTPQSSPPVTHSSVELDLIYDLRGHMELLHQEIMELRRSIKSCVYMQVKMQHSVIQNVAATRSVQKKERKPPRVGKTCFICGDMQVDTLLYRCGHMCTCFKCAVELQRTSGECPVCEAPIVDVVKAFAHEN